MLHITNLIDDFYDNEERKRDRERICDLECIRGQSAETRVLHEYVGPVRITLVDLIDVGFWPRVWNSGLITLANLYVAFVLVTVVLFSLAFRLTKPLNIHIPVCMVGLQLLLPSAILMINPVFGPATQMTRNTRLWQHIFLQGCTLLFGMFGGFHAMGTANSLPTNPHTITGGMALSGLLASGVLGPLTLYFTDATRFQFIHSVIGISTFGVSSMCACFGIIKPSFVKWCRKALIPEVPYMLLVICAAYTILIIMAFKCRIHERS